MKALKPLALQSFIPQNCAASPHTTTRTTTSLGLSLKKLKSSDVCPLYSSHFAFLNPYLTRHFSSLRGNAEAIHKTQTLESANFTQKTQTTNKESARSAALPPFAEKAAAFSGQGGAGRGEYPFLRKEKDLESFGKAGISDSVEKFLNKIFFRKDTSGICPQYDTHPLTSSAREGNTPPEILATLPLPKQILVFLMRNRGFQARGKGVT